MKKVLGILVLSLFCQTKLYAIEMSMFLNTHLKCEMFEREYNHNNDFKQDRTFQIKRLPDDIITIFISFDENFVFYSWHKKKKKYEEKDKIVEFNELKIVTEGQYYNWDPYLNYQKFINDPTMSADELIRNPGSVVFKIDREKGELVRYEVWGDGGGYVDKFKCKKINYFSLPKKKVDKKF